MMTIEIHDEEVARRLREIAERENRSIEDVIRSLIEHYLASSPIQDRQQDENEVVQGKRTWQREDLYDR